ncbi:MAG: putative tricarboxylic transport membrane protein [Parasphingorhabdus sp.]|jgi:putative tricarboxylic transport membrane protein
MGVLDYIWAGMLAVFSAAPAFEIFGFGIPITVVMVLSGFLVGIVVGSTPGLAGPMAMAISLPILISVFGYNPDALLPVVGFLIGIMKGATVGGAVPAILFNTPGTPDAYLTTRDGYPMTLNGEAGKALRVAHFSSASGDTFSDMVLFIGAPFLAVFVEAYLDLPEKTALIILSLTFISAAVGGSAARGLISAALGMLIAYVGTGEDFYPRLTMGQQNLASGFPIATAILGVLILGEVFKSIEDMMRDPAKRLASSGRTLAGESRLGLATIKGLFPYIRNSAVIGTMIGALPGIGSTLAATMGYASGQNKHKLQKNKLGPEFGKGAPEGVAATEAANSAVSGANLIPVLSLGIPGNAAAVFLILATDSIGGFNPGPSVFRFTVEEVNPELVMVFGIFTTMVIANLANWTIGGVFMRYMGIMSRVPKQYLIPSVLLVTLTAIYVEETNLAAVWYAIGFGLLGYFMRRLNISVLPFVIAYILAGNLEVNARQAFSASGNDPWFLFKSPISVIFILLSVYVVFHYSRRERQH